MHIDIVNILGLHVGIFESVAHSQNRTQTFGVGRGEVVGIGRKAAAGYLSIYLGSAGQSMFKFFKHEHNRTFTHHETVAALAERTGCRLGRVVAG